MHPGAVADFVALCYDKKYKITWQFPKDHHKLLKAVPEIQQKVGFKGKEG